MAPWSTPGRPALRDSDSVAIIVARRYASDDVAIAILQEDAAAVIAVEVLIVLAIAVEREVLDHDVGRSFARQQRKQRGARRFARQPEIFPQPVAQLEAVAGSGDQRAFDHVRGAIVGVLRPQDDAVSNAKSACVFQSDFLIVPVRVVRQRDGLRSDLGDDALRPAAKQPNFGRKIDRVSQRIDARQYPHRSAAQSSDVVHRRLNHLVITADKIGLLRTHGDREAFIPLRFVGVIAIGGPRIFYWRTLSSRRHVESRRGHDAAGSGEEASPAAGRI